MTTVSVETVGGNTAEIEVTLGPVTTVEVVGGTPGPPGPAGPPGIGTAAAYVHVQGVPSAVWAITHPLAFQPNVTVIDSANEQVEGDVIYGPLGSISLIFSGAFSGTAYLS